MVDSELAREKMWSRIHLIPLLTAEEDRDLVRRHLADQAREKELLGSVSSAYNSDRYVLVISRGSGRHAIASWKQMSGALEYWRCSVLIAMLQVCTAYIRSHTGEAVNLNRGMGYRLKDGGMI